MNTDDPRTAPDSLLEGKFSGRIAFQQLVRDALAKAARQGWNELIVSDATFEEWPLGERAVVESLQAWARTGRKLTVLAHHYDDMKVRHARFAQWRVVWDHIFVGRRCASADPLELPSGIWAPQWVMQRLDMKHCDGWAGSEPERRVRLRESLDEWLRRSSAGFPASTLGL